MVQVLSVDTGDVLMSVHSEAPLNGRVALVTGAAGDIGRAVALRLGAAGMTIVAADIDAGSVGLQATVGQLTAANVAVHPVAFDVTSDAQVENATAEIIEVIGVPTVVCNNAGYQGLFANTADYDVQDLDRVMAVNVRGVFSVLQHASRAMIAAGVAGSIVNTASMAGVGGAPNMAAYSASKAAVIGLTKSAAKDLAGSSIRVNAISPAFIGPGVMWDRQVELQAATPSAFYSDTTQAVEQEMIGQVPLRRYGSLSEVASAVEFLASPASSYITGFNLEVSGGAA